LGFNAFFTLELILRAVASGGPKAYLSNAWNIFDLLMVLAGYTEFLPASWFGKAPQTMLDSTLNQHLTCCCSFSSIQHLFEAKSDLSTRDASLQSCQCHQGHAACSNECQCVSQNASLMADKVDHAWNVACRQQHPECEGIAGFTCAASSKDHHTF